MVMTMLKGMMTNVLIGKKVPLGRARPDAHRQDLASSMKRKARIDLGPLLRPVSADFLMSMGRTFKRFPLRQGHGGEGGINISR